MVESDKCHHRNRRIIDKQSDSKSDDEMEFLKATIGIIDSRWINVQLAVMLLREILALPKAFINVQPTINKNDAFYILNIFLWEEFEQNLDLLMRLSGSSRWPKW